LTEAPIHKTPLDKCPKCGCEEFAYEDIDFMGGDLTQEMICSKCGAEYYEHYELLGWSKKVDWC
jgi:predicted nucleic-acid-binding Zn-ribbon protein